MKKQQTNQTEKKEQAPAQVKSAINEVLKKVTRTRQQRRALRSKLEMVCDIFQATSLELQPAAPLRYDGPTPDEYEQALLQA